MTCQVCLSTLKAGDLFCSSCGAAAPDHAAELPRAPAVEARGRIAGERKYLTVLCADLQRSTDLISDLDPEEAITRLEPALVAMRRQAGLKRRFPVEKPVRVDYGGITGGYLLAGANQRASG